MRARPHFNPFSVTVEYQNIDLSEIFPNADNHLIVEIGCAGGKFMLDYCKKNPNHNLIGLETRKPLVTKVDNDIKELGLNNAYILQANANIAINQLFKDSMLDEVFIFFPDPWVKKKHIKRRVVNEKLVIDTTRALKTGGKVFIQTDVEELAIEIKSFFENNKELTNINGPDMWQESNPTGCITEFESYRIKEGKPIYRLIYKKL